MRPKTKSCFEDLRTKSIIMVKKKPFEKNEDLMRTHFRAFEDPKSLFSLKCEMVIKKRVFTTLHILWQKLICSLWYDCYTYHFPGDACTTRCCWIFLYFFIYGRGTHFQIPWYITFGEDEAFCVKWGLNEDHFSSLVLMRTKSSIEDLYARTDCRLWNIS